MAQSQFDAFRDLDVTRDEIERIGAALKDSEFRRLFSEYVDEVTDPEQQRIFEKELAELERQRGIDVTFIHPQPGYVLKTSLNGSKKAFVNICSSEHIGQPTSKRTLNESGVKGLQWSLPHSLSPPREDVDNKRARCQVFDVVFHPHTLHLAARNRAFKNMVNRMACDALETTFECKLDQKNCKFPNLKFKGLPRATVIRKPIESFVKDTEDSEIMSKIYEQLPKYETVSQPKKVSKKDSDEKSKYTTPKYDIKHRSSIELEDFTYHRTAKLNSTVPRELVVEIHLPLLKAATDIELDVTEKTVQLQSEKPAKYKLSLTLPYKVDELKGNAKFDKDAKKLIVTLPVKRTMRIVSDFGKEDSGVESDHGSIADSEVIISKSPKVIEVDNFLDSSVVYNLPEFASHLEDNLIVTLAVKNVNCSTVEQRFDEKKQAMHLKFTSISSGQFPVYYAVYIQLPHHSIDPETSSVDVWDNNVIVQVGLKNNDTSLNSFFIGIDEEKTLEHKINCLNGCEMEKTAEDDAEKSLEDKRDMNIEVQKANRVVDTVELNHEPSRAINIARRHSESTNSDEFSCCSYSPKQKGILKSLASSRSSVSRSISESSIDEYAWASSFENCFSASQDCMIREEAAEETSASLKKTVRFNNNVLRQLFRSNSSILGQKKKNQRKNRNKKRAQERRYSESELSESGKERDSKTTPLHGFLKESKKEENIFAIDI